MNDETKQKLFLTEFRARGSITSACRAAGVTRQDVRDWRQDDVFARDMDDAFEDAIDEAEIVLRQRAIGVEVEVLDRQGNPIPKRDPKTGQVVLDDNFDIVYLTRTLSSDALLTTYMKAHRPAYRALAPLPGTEGGDGAQPISSVTVRYVLPDGKNSDDYDNK